MLSLLIHPDEPGEFPACRRVICYGLLMFNYAGGSWRVGRYRGAPVYIHWSTLIGLALYSRFTFSPAAWLAFVVVVLVHELGHAYFVYRARAEVDELVVYALGGECRWSGEVSALDRALIAWGGVFGQLAVVAVAVIVTTVWPSPPAFVSAMLAALIWPNLQLAAVNLIPIRPLDGAEAWALPGILWRRVRNRTATRRQRKATQSGQRELRLRVVSQAQSELRDLEDDQPWSEEANDVVERARRIAEAAAREAKKRPN